MIQISVVIFNEKEEVLICQLKDINLWEFPRGILGPGEKLGGCITRFCKQDLNIEVGIGDLLEIYSRECSGEKEAHVIVTGQILSGVLKKQFHSKIIWSKANDLIISDFTYYGKQVLDKIQTCDYCKYIHEAQPILDDYFKNVFDKMEEVLSFLDILSGENNESPTYSLAFNQILVHIRAFYIENKKLTKNITIQNYLRVYKREDLANDFDDILNLAIKSDLTLQKMIRESVDKFIVHYDKPSNDSLGIYQICKTVFSPDGALPLNALMQALQHLIMLVTTEMWYYAGELGVSMDQLKDITAFMASEREKVKTEVAKKLESGE